MKSRFRGNVTFLLVTGNISYFEDYRENHWMVLGPLHTTSSETVGRSFDSPRFHIFVFKEIVFIVQVVKFKFEKFKIVNQKNYLTRVTTKSTRYDCWLKRL